MAKPQNNITTCKKCFKEYTDIFYQWCKSCQINDLKANFTNWTSGDEKIDKFIQEMQLGIKYHYEIIFEWIPYNQFNNIAEIAKNGFSIVYLAKWKDIPHYDHIGNKWKRNSGTVLLNSQNTIDRCLNKV